MKKPLYSLLIIEALKIPLSLGLSENERKDKQWIEIYLNIYFSTLPHACKNDQIADTFCYATLVKKIENFCADRSFKLIEHVTYQLYQLVKKDFQCHDISIEVIKTPPIDNLKKCRFKISDQKSR